MPEALPLSIQVWPNWAAFQFLKIENGKRAAQDRAGPHYCGFNTTHSIYENSMGLSKLFAFHADDIP
jgi:hypothetical protein